MAHEIKTVIVDDEQLARLRITKLLESHPEIVVIGQCKSGTEAVETIEEKQPKLVFLDVQMPDMDGFSVLSRLHLRKNPFIIFTTAYHQYAVDAFAVHAVDYLVKPFDDDRFHDAVKRACSRIEMNQMTELGGKMIHLINEYRRENGSYLKIFSLKEEGRIISVAVEDILWIESAGNYISLHTPGGSFLYRMTMNALELELDPAVFLRIHRAIIVNMDHVEKVRYLRNNEYRFILKGGLELTSGRSFKESIRTTISRKGL